MDCLILVKSPWFEILFPPQTLVSSPVGPNSTLKYHYYYFLLILKNVQIDNSTCYERIRKSFEWQFLIQPTKRPTLTQPRRTHVGWIAPPLGTLKLNTDGGGSHNNEEAKARGTIRDTSGSWVGGFCCKLDLIIPTLYIGIV